MPGDDSADLDVSHFCSAATAGEGDDGILRGFRHWGPRVFFGDGQQKVVSATHAGRLSR